MKRFVCIVMSLMMVFTLAACESNEEVDNSTNSIITITSDINSSSGTSESQDPNNDAITDTNSNQSGSSATDSNTNGTTDSNTNSTTDSNAGNTNTNTDKNTNTSTNTNANTSTVTNTVSTNDTADSDVSDTVDSGTGDNVDEDDESVSLDNIDNGVLREVVPETMRVPENMKNLGTVDATEENNSETVAATVVLYCLDGDVVNWVTENDFIYAITAGNNRLVVINSNDMTPVYNLPLSGEPAEINIVDDNLYISFPDLYKIDVFAKDSGKKETTLYFDHAVSSFCLDGDYIYYSEHDQHCNVFKKNLVTGAEQMVTCGYRSTFYFPKLCLNKEDRILYVGESRSSGSAIYYFDADTLEIKSYFKKDDYGISNTSRELFHVGDEIFWGSYRLSDTNAKQVIGKYGNYCSVTFASEELISTFQGLFLTETYECVIDYFDAGFDFEYILVTESNNIFFRKRSFDRNIIIGVNFDLQ